MTYTIPGVDVNLSSVFQDKPNIGTDQLASLQANYTLSAADVAAAEAQLGRSLTGTGFFQVNLLAPGEQYGDRIRQWDFAAKKYFQLGGHRFMAGVDVYNILNNNVTLAFNQTFLTTGTGFLAPTSYMNPRVFRLAAEYSF